MALLSSAPILLQTVADGRPVSRTDSTRNSDNGFGQLMQRERTDLRPSRSAKEPVADNRPAPAREPARPAPSRRDDCCDEPNKAAASGNKLPAEERSRVQTADAPNRPERSASQQDARALDESWQPEPESAEHIALADVESEDIPPDEDGPWPLVHAKVDALLAEIRSQHAGQGADGIGKDFLIQLGLLAETDSPHVVQDLEQVSEALELSVMENDGLLKQFALLRDAISNLTPRDLTALEANLAQPVGSGQDLLQSLTALTESLDLLLTGQEPLMQLSPSFAARAQQLIDALAQLPGKEMPSTNLTRLVELAEGLATQLKGVESRGMASVQGAGAVELETASWNSSANGNGLWPASSGQQQGFQDLMQRGFAQLREGLSSQLSEPLSGEEGIKGFAQLMSQLTVARAGLATTLADSLTQPRPLDMPLGSRDWAAGVGERIQWMLGKGLEQAQIRLNPQHLGPLEIRIAMLNDQAQVSILAQHAMTREAVEASLPRLREMFQDANLSLGNVDVGQREAAGRQGQGEDQQPNRSGDGLDPEDDVSEELLAQTQQRETRGLVDDFA